MASVDAAPMPTDDVPKKARNNGRKALKQKNSSINGANIIAQTLSQSLMPIPAPETDPSKENHESLSQPRTEPKKAAAKGRTKKATTKNQDSFEKDLQDLQEMLEKMKIEKQKTEELLKEKDQMLKMKDEELDVKEKEQEKLQMELKKLQKMKEFKPNMVCFLISISLCLFAEKIVTFEGE